jgi:SAM-dependent methyltransferase
MQHDRLTPEELAAMPAKTKKNPAVVDLYLKHDFLTAYAMHTDMRVGECPEGAVGNHLEWDTHGEYQKDFLISRGLKPNHRLLEIGCGTGRLARKVVPYLDFGNYCGVDISEAALEYARELADREGWASNQPVFSMDYPKVYFDFGWAFSVMIHLPEWEIKNIMRRVAKLMRKHSQFLFSFVPEKVSIRTGLKQFRETLAVYKNACTDAGLSFEEIPWPHQQHIALARRVDLGSS